MNKPQMRIAIVGIRGIPANYSGYETFAEELSTRLVKNGHHITVYCRKDKKRPATSDYKGVKLVFLPTIKHKYFETLVHTFFSAVHVVFTKASIVYFCNTINSIFLFIPRMFGKKVLMNVDGLEWKRKKWSNLGKLAYRISERIATLFANEIISDSKRIQAYYKEQFKRNTKYISYGANINTMPPGAMMEKYGLKKRRFVLYVSRLEPENNAHIVIKAYEKVFSDMPLVIVGDAPYAKKYIAGLRSTQDKRIIFTGYVFGERCNELRSNAYMYIHGNEVGGTNPALLEAMAYGNCIIVNGVKFNREVIGHAGLWYEPNNTADLIAKIEYLMANPNEAEKYRSMAIGKIKSHYNWDMIAEEYENLFKVLLKI